MKKRFLNDKLRIIFIFITIILAQSCGVVTSVPYEPIAFKKETTKNGLIFGSITFPNEKAQYNGYFIQMYRNDSIKKIANKNSIEIRFVPQQIFKMKHDGQLENGKTYLFTLEREEGNYNVSGLRLFNNYGYSTRESFIKNFNIRFDVKKGEIIYIGNIIFDESMLTDKHPVQLGKNLERDVEAIKILQPSVDWSRAIDNENIKINYSIEK